MHGNAWASLLQHIPAELHDQLVLVTVGGTEIALNTILRIDHEFLAFKGRLAASQDQGRLFFLPYQNIDYIGFQREVKDEKYHEVFGALDVPAPPTALPPAVLTSDPAHSNRASPAIGGPRETEDPASTGAANGLPESEPEPQTDLLPVAPSANLTPRPLTIKSAILERFRSRSSQGTSLRPNGEG